MNPDDKAKLDHIAKMVGKGKANTDDLAFVAKMLLQWNAEYEKLVEFLTIHSGYRK